MKHSQSVMHSSLQEQLCRCVKTAGKRWILRFMRGDLKQGLEEW